MKNIICFLFLLTAFKYPKAQTVNTHTLENIIDDNNLAGLQLAYSANGKTTFYNAGFGRQGQIKKVNSHTIFHAGSLGKAVFAYAVMRLYDRGLINIDTPLLHYIGTYNRFDSTDTRYDKITARMVLSHSSGLAEFSEFGAAKVKLLFEPGTSFSYSGEGIWSLQKVVEGILKKPFEQIMQEEVFKPLQMISSTYVQTKIMDSVMLGSISKDMAWMYPNAAFSLLTNARDYNKFLQALLIGKGLKPATQKLMFAKQTNAQWFNRDTTAADKYIDWGLGLGLQQNEKGTAIWHWGSTEDFYSFFIAYPKTRQSLVFFTRGERGLKPADQIVNLFLGKQTTHAMQWLNLGYEQPETMAQLYASLRQQGFNNRAAIFNSLKAKGYIFSERDINGYGNNLLKQKRYTKAIAILNQEVKWYPQNPNAYSSLAAAYEAAGNKQAGLNNYRQSLSLDTTNVGVKYHIKAMENAGKLNPSQLSAFEGKFKREDNGMFVQFKVTGNKLILTQSWDGGTLEFFRVGDLEFYNDEPGFTLKFTKDENGNIDKEFINDVQMGWVKEK
jgi:CubicO group peptidase (beta-lactamase class C family)